MCTSARAPSARIEAQGQPIRSRRGCGNEAELLEHQKPVEHQFERDVLAVAEAEHLNVVQPHGAAGWWDVAHRAVKDAKQGPFHTNSMIR